jgi:hypothetical protein
MLVNVVTVEIAVVFCVYMYKQLGGARVKVYPCNASSFQRDRLITSPASGLGELGGQCDVTTV